MELPFPDDAFDVVVSAWVIETVAVPARAVKEYLRVLALLPTGPTGTRRAGRTAQLRKLRVGTTPSL